MSLLPQVVPNTLVDTMLLVGLDDNTGLLPAVKHDGDILPSMYDIEYDPQVLATISARDMVHFFPFLHRDQNYPPIIHNDSIELCCSEMHNQRDRMRSAEVLNPRAFKQSLNPKKTGRSVSLNPKVFIRQDGIRRQATTNVIPELPINDEHLRSIPAFCFPDGLQVYQDKPEQQTHYLVLTNVSGNKSFAVCLTFYRRYLVEKDDQGHIYMTLAGISEGDSEEGKHVCYIPQCCVTLAKYPYFTKMKECLSSMVSRIERDPEEMMGFLKEYAHILTHTPVPPAGNISVELNLFQMLVTFMPPDHPDKLVIDVPLHLVFLCLPIEELLKLLVCVMLEERIVFLSANISLLTVVMESILSFILPFKWCFTYVTLLPSHLLDYLQAPGVFMFGCHVRHKHEVMQVDGLVLIDLDEGTVTLSHDPEADGDTGTRYIPSLPKEAASIFINKSSSFRRHIEFQEIQRPFCYNLEDLRQHRIDVINQQNAAISHACLGLMVNLFRGVVHEMRVQHNMFHMAPFLSGQSEADRPFYKQVFGTYMFKAFLEDRMAGKVDYWSDMEMKSRGFGSSKSTAMGTCKKIVHKPKNVPLQPREITPFRLPDVDETSIYAGNAINALSKAIQECGDFDRRSSYIYLRSLFHVTAGNKMAAMEDFFFLAGTCASVLPNTVLKDVYSSLSEAELAGFAKKAKYAPLLDIIEALVSDEGPARTGRRKICVDPVSIPDRDLHYEEFVEYVSLLEMSNDFETITRLFEALNALQRLSTVEQITFQMCVAHWEDNQVQCGSVKIGEGRPDDLEDILKLSHMVKTDFGIGRIALTGKRLFFLKDVSNAYQHIVTLRNIRSLEKSQHISFLSAVDTLQIYRKDGTLFTAHLKEERNWWYMVIHEVWAGKVVAEATRDIMAVPLAVENALLIDAVIACGQEECSTHHQDVEGAAAHLASYSTYMRGGRHIQPRDTIQALQHKVDPNVGERERKTVQALLYTGGDLDDVTPRLWCGLSDGKIKVYNAISWVLESKFVQTKGSVACLTAIGGSQVWAGSYGVFIIDTETVTCNKTLMDHPDLVVDIVPYNSRYAFTASLDGTIIKWDVQKLTHAQPAIQLQGVRSLRSLKVHQDRLFCGSWSSILMTDLQGQVLHTFRYTENDRVIELDSFLVLPNSEIWAGCRREGKLIIWDARTAEYTDTVVLDGPDVRGISIMELVEGRLWVGNKAGVINIITVDTRKPWKVLHAHEDAVRVLYDVRDRYMISGGGSKDGKVAIWSATANTTDSGNFLDISAEHFT